MLITEIIPEDDKKLYAFQQPVIEVSSIDRNKQALVVSGFLHANFSMVDNYIKFFYEIVNRYLGKE